VSFSNEWTVKAGRVQKTCCACPIKIEIGQPAVHWTGMTDGDFAAVSYHPECRAAEIAFNNLRGTYGDEWDSLDEMEPEDREWLLAKHPIVAARFGMTTTRPDAGDIGEK
jgi:hypothetical protein